LPTSVNSGMDEKLAVAQALKYAEELRDLHRAERAQRRAAEQALASLKESYDTTVHALADSLELRDDQTRGHAERVTRLALQLTREVAPDLADQPDLEYGFLLHDLGKIGIRDAILLKPGPLDPEEMAEMRTHTTLGANIVDRIPHLTGLARDVVASHHEAWSGGGYPNGLQRDEIPLVARIFAVVDSFDAMTNDRPYRQARTASEALAEIERCAGTQFDPEIACAFVVLARSLRAAA
jgi:HD-GYP domain-containing protein (c-di-GMP phosphodiesterase class II)